MNDITFEKFVLSNYADCSIVTDGNIAKLYNISGDNVYLLPQGEQAKCFQHVQELCSWFLSRNLTTTHDKVVAIGGGSIGDTVGFAASIYKRGLKVLHVPTTLIAQIDSSIGGKTAIDLDGVKNAVGTYHSGDTLIDVDFLATLPQEQLLSGQGEIIKYRMLSQEVEDTYCNGKGSMLDVIKACVRYKQRVCDADPFCRDIRNTLNLGHTIGHALELSYGIAHGVAVANGIYYETVMASKLKLCSAEYANLWTDEIAEKFTIYPITDKVLTLTLNDKKNARGKVCFVLPHVFAKYYLTLDEVRSLLNA